MVECLTFDEIKELIGFVFGGLFVLLVVAGLFFG